MNSRRRWSLTIKKTLDHVAAASALVLLSPLLILIGALVWLTLGWPPIFTQLRSGYLGRPFRIIKFRTMTTARDATGVLLPDAQRLTRFGRFLRSTSLDELPEFWNVLRGELSLVGPRPLLMRYLPRYSPEQARRHDVLPGITGWSQVCGRNDLTWEQKFSLDLYYVDHWSLWLDCQILWLTVAAVVTRKGISRTGHATMPEFARAGDPTTRPHAREEGRRA